MKVEYKVRNLMDSTYQVVMITTVSGYGISAYEFELDDISENVVFQGSISDCESYIRLMEGGYM